MNSYVIANLFNKGLKKYFAVTIATLAFVIALPVMAVFSMGGDAVSFLSGTASAVSAEEQGFYMGGPVPGDTYAWGNCTYWAFANRLWANKPIPTTWGNANTWDDNAILDGYLVDHTPQVGAVMQSNDAPLGHVAYVTNVDSETGQWKISEMNAPHLNVVSSRTFDKSAAIYYNFIHDRIGVTP
jgi:surface antigen